MALIDNTTYTGKDTAGFYSTALIKGTSKEMFTMVPNVKSKVKMAKMDLGNIIQADSCTFSASGDATLAQKDLEVCDLKVNLELCTKDFEVNYLSETLRAGSNNNEIPTEFQAYFLEQVALKISEQLENTVWLGNPDGSPVVGVCQGLLELFGADGTVIDLAASPASVTAASIMSEVGRVYAAIPKAVKQSKRATIFMSIEDGSLYRQALVAANPALIAYNGNSFNLSYIETPIVEVAGLPAGTMVACDPKNLWYGTDLVSDENSIKILDMSNTTGDETVRFITHFKFGVNYGVGAEIVYFR